MYLRLTEILLLSPAITPELEAPDEMYLICARRYRCSNCAQHFNSGLKLSMVRELWQHGWYELRVCDPSAMPSHRDRYGRVL